jgi:hypothetical protein
MIVFTIVPSGLGRRMESSLRMEWRDRMKCNRVWREELSRDQDRVRWPHDKLNQHLHRLHTLHPTIPMNPKPQDFMSPNTISKK